MCLSLISSGAGIQNRNERKPRSKQALQRVFKQGSSFLPAPSFSQKSIRRPYLPIGSCQWVTETTMLVFLSTFVGDGKAKGRRSLPFLIELKDSSMITIPPSSFFPRSLRGRPCNLAGLGACLTLSDPHLVIIQPQIRLYFQVPKAGMCRRALGHKGPHVAHM